MRSVISILGLMILLAARPAPAAETVSLLLMDTDTVLASSALKRLETPPGVEVRFFTAADLEGDSAAAESVRSSGVILVDVMMEPLSRFVLEHVDAIRVPVYALRGSRNDEELQKRGFRFDPGIRAYFENPSVANVRNMVLRAIHEVLDASVAYDEPVLLPRCGVYHPDGDRPFHDPEAYLEWYAETGRARAGGPWIGVPFYGSSMVPGQKEALDNVMGSLEKAGFNVLAGFGPPTEVLSSILLDRNGRSRVDLVLAFSLKFQSALDTKMRSALAALNVPVINGINLFSSTLKEWREDPQGIPPMEVAWTLANPEISGLIEPTPLAGKVPLSGDPRENLFVRRTIDENLALLLPRLKRWIRLARTPMEEKRIAILYYNHSQGKQNIGASYLNVFQSLETILARLKAEGVRVQGEEALSREGLQASLLRSGRNVGSWAPGELDRMVVDGDLVRVSMAEYRSWFESLPKEFRDRVVAQWGPPESSRIMVQNEAFIIPAVRFGNIVLMPEPARGWGDEPMKLYHDPSLQPHHQYIAAYLWLKKGFQADVVVHLGTHATHEWLPGKQAGLSHACPPEVLLGDLPNIYPYIVDDVGEAIQAKRRGRGVIVDHLTPPLVRGGLYGEYAEIYETIQRFNQADAMEGRTRSDLLSRIQSLAAQTGLLSDLDMHEVTADGLEEVEHHLLEIWENHMPYGLHTFGVSPGGEALGETVEAVAAQNPERDRCIIRQGFQDSGPREMDRLVHALKGGYVPPGEGNDPLRNPEALPTGRNVYGFDPRKIPSPSAWALGVEAAEQIVAQSLEKKGRFPEKVAVVLWATETIRNEGINESTILYLMGMRPTWDASGRVTGTEVIPGGALNRPRLDVLVNPSGLYRDLFPNLLLLIDDAVTRASAQTDLENLIRRNSERMRERLVREGMDAGRAETLSRVRIFTERPGAYGNGVSEMASNSGLWESDEEIARVYENRTGYAFGRGMWGEEARKVFHEQLRDVDTAVHSISSAVYGTLDNDDLFQYLGGLSLAVRRAGGESPKTVLTMNRDRKEARVEDLARVIGRESRTRYFNPKWVRGMQKEGYAGAREMARFAEYLWGWQVTTPEAVDRTAWEQTFEVYVEDKYDLGLERFFDRENPWAHQSMTARMLECVRKGYWDADETVRRRLAVSYAVNVVEKGVACCDHTCNNPLLNQMVVNILSLPGVISPEVAAAFQAAVEQSAGKALDEEVRERRALQGALTRGFSDTREQAGETSREDASTPRDESSDSGEGEQMVEGYRMEAVDPDSSTERPPSSGAPWWASLLVLFCVGLFGLGASMGGRKSEP